MNAELHTSGRADGSCLLRQVDSIQLATVHGPNPCPTKSRDFENLKINVAFRMKEENKRNRKVDFLLRHVLDHAVDKKLFPRQMLQCNVQEIEGCNGNASGAVNATCLALLDAAVPLNHLFSSVHISGGECAFDFVFKQTMAGSELIGSANVGVFTIENYEIALNKAQELSFQVFDFYREAMTEKFTARLSYGVGMSANKMHHNEDVEMAEVKVKAQEGDGPSFRKKSRNSRKKWRGAKSVLH